MSDTADLVRELRETADASPPTLVSWRRHVEFVLRRAADLIEELVKTIEAFSGEAEGLRARIVELRAERVSALVELERARELLEDWMNEHGGSGPTIRLLDGTRRFLDRPAEGPASIPSRLGSHPEGEADATSSGNRREG